jgi:hypothetical protein
MARANEARLFHQAIARESVSLAAIRLAEGKIEEADALLAETPLESIEPSLEAAKLFRTMGDWNAIRQRWQQAADCYRLYLLANRLDQFSVPQADVTVIAIAPTLVEAGRFQEYHAFRKHTLSLIGRMSSQVDVSNSLKACLLMPADDEELVVMQPHAQTIAAILSTPGHPQAMGAYQGAFDALALAMMGYRGGDFAGALEWSRKCLAYPDANQARASTAHAIAALATGRLGQVEQARVELARARAIFTGPFDRDVYFPRGPGQGHWLDWAIARIFEREAGALVDGAGTR